MVEVRTRPFASLRQHLAAPAGAASAPGAAFPPGCPVVNDMDATLVSLGRHQSGIDVVTASRGDVTGGVTGMNVTTGAGIDVTSALENRLA